MWKTTFTTYLNLPAGAVSSIAAGLAIPGLQILGESDQGGGAVVLSTNQALTSGQINSIVAAINAAIVTASASVSS